MPLFRRKHKPSAAASAFRSVEHLPAAPGVYPDDDLDRRFSVSTSRERLPPLPVTSTTTNNKSSTAVNTIPSATTASASTSTTPGASPQLYQQENTTQEYSTSYPLRRSKSQRHTSPRGNNSSDDTPVRPASPAPILDADPDHQSWPLPAEPLQPVEPEPRKSRRSLFSLHSSAAARDQSGILQRSRSVKKISAGRPSKQQRPLSIDTTSERRPGTSWSREHELDAPWPKVPQARRPQQQPPPPPQQQQQQQQQPQQQPPAFVQGQAPPPQPQSQGSTPSHTPAESPVQPPRNQLQTQQQPHCRSPMPQNTGPTPTLDTRPPRSPHPSVQRSNTDSGLLEHLTRPSPVEPSRQPADLAPTPPQLDPTVGPRPSSRQSLGPPSPLRPLPVHHPDTVASGMPDRPSAPSGQSPVPGHSTYPEAGFRNNTASTPEQGRNTPSSRDSRRDREDAAEIDVRALVQKHDELQAKYSKVKRYYFEKEAQVQHLQNTVAHQRMAVSRTVLDDNEYANRFGRLDGAIKDLAFSIRKDWATLPSWLNGYVNDDAHTTGTKEMTAIGRAVMSRWLVEELFERYFHPALEPTFSRQLKSIEMNLRRQQVQPSTEEDKENAIARISNWRRTTLDGLTNLQGPQADEYRAQLIDRLINSLVATLIAHLHDPPPPGLDNGARMIVENAVGIAEKIPLESRDICVEYILPGTVLQEGTMKVETGLPPLTHVRTESGGSAEQERAEGPDEAEGGGGADNGPPQREQRMRSVFSSLMGRRPGPSAPTGETREERERGPGRIRFASFVTAEVRGRGPMNVLVKAPVYVE
ncbi:hypothetical protein AbraIFM66951_009813 [Aspergillus brasiliensis]|uniref:S-adenosylmethionine-dependent methyltransferase-like protein n=1 Tax=Aspergillus brasiliensis TaxID=319629 RepID=A0A9W5YMJ2_9EURO|nr:hypothetical protein AbraCBS73388_004730 [Aspergillus brasiliensis]GKZ46673.1 hypothetical protein AbraIFM66951_009813 [Aspergillus brasiliensis]